MRDRSKESPQDRVQAVAQEILDAFESGVVPAALAQMFLRRDVDVPSRHWSRLNRLIAARRKHIYAAGFRQWEKLGRKVKKGERAFHILGPRTQTFKEDDPESGAEIVHTRVLGFLSIPVFGYFQTEGRPLAGADEAPRLLETLPLLEVARAWDISIETFDVADTYGPDFIGVFNAARNSIGLGVRNLSTWAHELVHAADHRLGLLKPKSPEGEIVAELGGAVLLECLGYTVESDRGGAWELVGHVSRASGKSMLAACNELLERTCRCVELLITEAERVGASHRVEGSGAFTPSDSSASANALPC